MQLHEKYRPSEWSDVVGQDKALRTVRALQRRGVAGRAYWISGQSGVGKTTVARLLAEEVADAYFIEELDATDLTPAALRQIEQSMAQYGWGKGGRAYLINEAHGLRRDTIRQLLVLLERLPDHVVVIFTTTIDGQDVLFDGNEDAGPLLSRCHELRLTNQGLAKAFAERAKRIAESEGMDGRPINDYVKLVRDCRNNMRAVLQRIDAGEMLAE
jgi:DNA polymerase III gamma/tau subunit